MLSRFFWKEVSGRKRKEGLDRLSKLPIVLSEPDSSAAEAFRALRTSLLYAIVDAPPRTIVLTSPGSCEGKSTVCANLGAALARANRRTLVVDCDLRNPAQHSIFGLRNFRGIVNVLAGELELQEVCQEPSSVPGLSVVTVGLLPPDPAELLGSQSFAEFLDRASQGFEYVLMDAPPTQPVSDSLILASQVDGVLLVFDSRTTRKAAVRRSMHALTAVGANVLGIVMNSAMISEAGHYGGYSYGYMK